MINQLRIDSFGCTGSIAMASLMQVMQLLDGEGKARAVKILRNLPRKTILVVGQADSHLVQASQKVGTVVKRNGCASIE